MMSRFGFAAIVFAAIVGGGCDICRDGAVDVVVTDTNAAIVLAVCADIAATQAARSRGLADRDVLADGAALLLPLPTVTDVCIENRDVVFAIDVVFVGAKGAVIDVVRDIPAGDNDVHCADDVEIILECNAGVASTVEVGDTIEVGKGKTQAVGE